MWATPADVLCELLEVLIHQILYIRELYPKSIFVTKKKYGAIVHQSEHPLLNEYIQQTLKAVHFHINGNHLRRVFICITSSDKLLERYVFDILDFGKIDRQSMLIMLEQQFRAFCLKLTSSNLYLEPLPKDAEFGIQLHTTEYSSVAFNENSEYSDFPWIQTNPGNNAATDIIPVYSIKSDKLHLQMYIEKPDVIISDE